MAVIDGQVPPAERIQSPARVVVKLTETAYRERSASGSDNGLTQYVRRAAPDADLKPYFSEDEADDGVRHAASVSPFDRYVAINAENADAAAELAQNLRSLDEVEDAYVEGGPVPPPVNAADDPRSGAQGYLQPAPAGIDARWAWTHTDGNGVGFVDLERGWTFAHEDLAAAGVTLISGLSQDFHGHGTAVLGEVLAVDNARGGIGIAPNVRGRVVSQWRSATDYNTAAAILSASSVMSAGDVLLLEAQTHAEGLLNLPVEVETAVFDAIRAAVDAGIVVVEAAGNGSNDLDTSQTAAGDRVLDRGHADFRDSGAIMVAAGSSATPHTRLGFSNWGSRIDCFGWGENVTTTGDGWMGTSTTEYTTGFGGTSSASPIVAGAAVLLQSWRKHRHGRPFDPVGLRRLMTSPALNTASANPAADRIGVLPDLRSILELQIANDKWRIDHDDFISFVFILFGLIDDSPGVVWIPGRGPVPVDPDWGTRVNSMGAPERDLLAALAVHEVAKRVQDDSSRTQLAQSAAKAMHAAVDRIAGQ